MAEISHGELVQRFADAYERLGGQEMQDLWNEFFPDSQVKYLGDSMYAWAEDTSRRMSNG